MASINDRLARLEQATSAATRATTPSVCDTPAFRERYGRLSEALDVVSFRPHFDTPEAEIFETAMRTAATAVDYYKIDLAKSEAMYTGIAEWVAGLSAKEWAEQVISAGYRAIWAERIAKALKGATV